MSDVQVGKRLIGLWEPGNDEEAASIIVGLLASIVRLKQVVFRRWRFIQRLEFKDMSKSCK